jgi:aspartyl-tRNA(Asn)/glutamyl-tRNA(Gln) amidotransferase subunit A
MSEIQWMTALELVEAYREKKLSPVEVVHTLFDRIERVNPKINAFVTLVPEMAEEAAREAERAYMGGRARPLEGVPVAIKDNAFTKGVRTTFGSKLYEDFVPEEDGVLVERLKGAGAIVLGKTNLPEFGLIPVTDNLLFGKSRNPWNLKKTTGGSSGGSAAAVASGLCPIAHGNDGGGSIRIPAALCGVFGLKPQFGRVPSTPHLPGWETLVHDGPIARSVKDAALMLDVMAGPSRRDHYSIPSYPGKFLEDMQGDIQNLNIAYSPDLGFAPVVDSEVLKLTRQAAFSFEEMGCVVEEIDAGLLNMEMDLLITVISETVAAHEEDIERWKPIAFPLYLPFLELANLYNNKDVVRIQFHRSQLWEQVSKIFDQFDLLLCPTTAVPAFDLEELGPIGPLEIEGKEVGPLAWMSFTYPFNFTGQPAATVPCGFNSEGLPVGLQIVGDRFQEALVLRAAANFERAHPWKTSKPPVD